jgi:hypothetical protein
MRIRLRMKFKATAECFLATLVMDGTTLRTAKVEDVRAALGSSTSAFDAVTGKANVRVPLN